MANVLIVRGFDGRSRGQGAFLSIVVTFTLSALLWLFLGTVEGYPAIGGHAVMWFALAGILTVLIGRVFLYASIQSLGAIRGSIIKRLNPVFSVLLGVWLLNESVGGSVAIGMAMIFASFGMLAWHSLQDHQPTVNGAARLRVFGRVANIGYVLGPVSALAYASGYIMRKQGLDLMPDAIFGTLIGAVAGMIAFLLLALVSDRYRTDVIATFTIFNPWLLLAGISSTLGQICYFVALKYSTVSKIALIASMEVFMTVFLTFIVMRGKVRISRDLIIAASLGVIGTVFLIAV